MAFYYLRCSSACNFGDMCRCEFVIDFGAYGYIEDLGTARDIKEALNVDIPEVGRILKHAGYEEMSYDEYLEALYEHDPSFPLTRFYTYSKLYPERVDLGDSVNREFDYAKNLFSEEDLRMACGYDDPYWFYSQVGDTSIIYEEFI